MDINNDLLDPEQPRKKALVDELSGGTADGPTGMPGSAGNPNTGIGGVPDVSQVASPQAAPSPTAPPAQTWSPGAKAGQDVTLLGFDSAKLFDPNSGSAAGSKYTNDAKVFAQGLKQDVGLSRGGLGNMVNFYHGNGFPDATAVGDDKIDPDGPGPQAPIDVIRSDGQIVYQNTTGNPYWEGQGFKPDTGGQQPQGGGLFSGSSISPLLQGDAQGGINAALQNIGGLGDSSRIQELIKALGGGQ
jgi:hypothetical protein